MSAVKWAMDEFPISSISKQNHILKPVTSTLGSRSIFESRKQMPGQDVAPSNLATSLFSLEFSPLEVCDHGNHVNKFVTWVFRSSRDKGATNSYFDLGVKRKGEAFQSPVQLLFVWTLAHSWTLKCWNRLKARISDCPTWIDRIHHLPKSVHRNSNCEYSSEPNQRVQNEQAVP